MVRRLLLISLFISIFTILLYKLFKDPEYNMIRMRLQASDNPAERVILERTGHDSILTTYEAMTFFTIAPPLNHHSIMILLRSLVGVGHLLL